MTNLKTMTKRGLVVGALLVLAGIWTSPSLAAEKDLMGTKLKVNGVYNVWGISQNEFFFGAKKQTFGSNKDNYVVQMLRFNVSLGTLGENQDDIKLVTRFDLAQGWWGVDNAGDKSVDNGQFNDKGTFFDVHVDHAYLDFRVPHTKARVMLGRFHHALGNKLILDDDMDGIKFVIPIPGIPFGEKTTLNLAYAKPFEGDGDLAGTGTPVGDAGLNSLNDRGSTKDANMFSIALDHTSSKGNRVSAWFLFYDDQSGDNDDTAYITQGLGYARPRFTPQVTRLNVFGASATHSIGPVTLSGEFDYLFGDDDINNSTFNGNTNDINNGDLSGYTAYLDANWGLGNGSSVGMKFGIGSGDRNPSGGSGNITKLKTQGFFYFTEVWEDSIMPDVAGITPQGIGAPNTRGYREFENTTAFQIYGKYALNEFNVSLFGSYTYLMATEDVHGWNAGGPTSESSDNIGHEVDAVFSWKMYKPLTFAARFGYFFPGDASLLLVNGHTNEDNNAWELKGTLTFKF